MAAAGAASPRAVVELFVRKQPFRSIQIVATPGSGNGRCFATARALQGALERKGHRVALATFRDLDRLQAWGCRPRGDFSLLVCVGGDGTMDAVAGTAIARFAPILPVPAGFGDLFGRALGCPRDVASVVALADGGGEIVGLDVGLKDGVAFLCHESFGFIHDIQDRTERAFWTPQHRGLRLAAYFRTALRHLVDTPLEPMRVVVDGRPLAHDAIVATIANVETYGSWLRLTPDASPVDGLFDVFLVRQTTKRRMLAKLVAFHLGLAREDPHVVVGRGSAVAISDGKGFRADLVVAPRSLRFLVTPAAARALSAGAPARRVA
ncbi:MAG TPA: diacylglycerol kinase family protein [Candidatus Binatia bacterium]|nr:diacylglycerol kinase family protein [Candidatus Binatia bacterium]